MNRYFCYKVLLNAKVKEIYMYMAEGARSQPLTAEPHIVDRNALKRSTSQHQLPAATKTVLWHELSYRASDTSFRGLDCNASGELTYLYLLTYY